MTSLPCPECGVDLANKSRPKHASAHWGVEPNTITELKAGALERAKRVLGVS